MTKPDERDDLPPEQPEDNDLSAADAASHLVEILSSDNYRKTRKSHADGPPSQRRVVFTIRCTDDGRLSFHIFGKPTPDIPSMPNWPVNFGVLNVQINDLGRYLADAYHDNDSPARAAWRHVIHEIGAQIYQGLQHAHPHMMRLLAQEYRRFGRQENLTVVFEGPRDYLSVPYELAYTDFAPLGMSVPICRTIAGSTPPPGVTFDKLLRTLKHEGRPLRCLLISSGLRHEAADQETGLVERTIRNRAIHLGLSVEIETIPAENAGLAVVREKLARCPYHIVHYAGEVFTDPDNPADSGLLLSATHAARLGGELLPVDELGALLQGGSAALVYFSPCLGPQTWGGHRLQEHNYLSLLETPVRAGVGTVLGFRWPVMEHIRLRFAGDFYSALLAAPAIPERAVYRARVKFFPAEYDSEIWASALLVVQNPYA